MYAQNTIAITVQNVLHALSGKSLYIHHLEINGNARSISAIANAHTISSKNNFL